MPDRAEGEEGLRFLRKIEQAFAETLRDHPVLRPVQDEKRRPYAGRCGRGNGIGPSSGGRQAARIGAAGDVDGGGIGGFEDDGGDGACAAMITAGPVSSDSPTKDDAVGAGMPVPRR